MNKWAIRTLFRRVADTMMADMHTYIGRDRDKYLGARRDRIMQWGQELEALLTERNEDVSDTCPTGDEAMTERKEPYLGVTQIPKSVEELLAQAERDELLRQRDQLLAVLQDAPDPKDPAVTGKYVHWYWTRALPWLIFAQKVHHDHDTADTNPVAPTAHS